MCRGMYRAKGVACVIICTLEETGEGKNSGWKIVDGSDFIRAS